MKIFLTVFIYIFKKLNVYSRISLMGFEKMIKSAQFLLSYEKWLKIQK